MYRLFQGIKVTLNNMQFQAKLELVGKMPPQETWLDKYKKTENGRWRIIFSTKNC